MSEVSTGVEGGLRTGSAGNMLLEMAVGDAYGAGFEYASAEIVRDFNDLTGYRYRKSAVRQFTGKYTDDTQMSLAIAEATLEEEEWTAERLAQRFVDVFHRDPRGGYAHRFQEFLESTRSGSEFLEKIKPNSDKSGSAMRATPLGVLPDARRVRDLAALQARVTHDTPDGIAAAQAAALMPHYFLYHHGAKADLGAFLEDSVPGYPWATPWEESVGEKGWMSVRAAVTAITQYSRLSRILRACIDFTGDVDTVAAIALAAASCSPEIVQNLPLNLVNSLENGPYGRQYLIDLDRRLLALAPPSDIR